MTELSEREERERKVIGALLYNDERYIDIIDKAYSKLKAKYFVSDFGRTVFDLLRSLYNKGSDPNVELISETLKSLGLIEDKDEFKKSLVKLKEKSFVDTPSLGTYTDKIIDEYTADAINTINNSDIDVKDRILQLEGVADEYRQSTYGASDTGANALEYLNSGYLSDMESYKNTTEISTGFKKLDCFLGEKAGLLPERLYVLGAVTSLGKTTFVHQMADNIASQGVPVLYFSLEQSKLELINKSIVRKKYVMYSEAKSRKNGETLTSVGMLMKQGLDKPGTPEAIEAYKKEIAENMYIFESNFNTNIDVIEATIKRFKRKHRKMPVVIVDYLQILKPSDDCKARETKERMDILISGLKVIARNEKIPVIVISSFNRKNYDQQAEFSAFKESGAIEYSADVVLALQLQLLSDKSGITAKDINDAKGLPIRKIELVCLKNRGGRSTFTTYYDYKPQYEYFEEREKDK